MYSKNFHIDRIKQQYNNLSRRQRQMIAGGGIILLVVLAGISYVHSQTAQLSRTAESANVLEKALEARGNRDYTEAAELFGKHARAVTGRERTRAFVQQARMYERNEQPENALKSYQAASRTGKDTVEIVGGIAHNASKVQDFGLAVTHYKQLLRLVRQNQGQIEDPGRFQKRIPRMINDLELRWIHQLAQRADNRVYDKEKEVDTAVATKAIEEYEQAIKLARGHPRVNDEQLQTYRRSLQETRALKANLSE